MSILSNELFNTPVTFDNVEELCKNKPYTFYKKLIDSKNLDKNYKKYIGSTDRIFYSRSRGTYYDMRFSLYTDELIVFKCTNTHTNHVRYIHNIDCVETVIAVMDDYFKKYEFLKGDSRINWW